MGNGGCNESGVRVIGGTGENQVRLRMSKARDRTPLLMCVLQPVRKNVEGIVESKVLRLTHEVVDGVCLHLTAENALMLRALIARGVNYGFWDAWRPGQKPIQEFGYQLASDITAALNEAPPACKE